MLGKKNSRESAPIPVVLSKKIRRKEDRKTNLILNRVTKKIKKDLSD